MSVSNISFSKLNSDHIMAVLRIALGVVFVIGGLKLAFPAVANTDALSLAASYVNPDKGWISSLFEQKIVVVTGLSISAFLQIQGFLEIALGVMLMMGMFVPLGAVIGGLMFWVFAVANPVSGEIRLSRDIALMGLCFAVALNGSGAWTMDGVIFKWRSYFSQRKDLVLVLLRLSLAFTLLSSSIFSGGVFNSPLNTTLPTLLVFFIGLILVAGILPRWTMGLVFVWMLFLIGNSLITKDLFSAFDSIKREIGFLAASMVYVLLGPDRWAFPRTQQRKPANSQSL